MTTRALLDATRTALAGVLGAGWTVGVADDEWTAIEMLGEAPSGIRALLIPDDFIANPIDPKGIAGKLTGRLVVQQIRGMDKDPATPQGRLLDAEERARRALLAIVFQLPGDPDYTAGSWTDPSQSAHPEVTGFRQTGAGAYKPPEPDLRLQHPAREIRWSTFMAMRLTPSLIRVDLPIAAGN